MQDISMCRSILDVLLLCNEALDGNMNLLLLYKLEVHDFPLREKPRISNYSQAQQTSTPLT